MSDAPELVVIGYPRSGNTWAARLLGDALDSTVTGPPHAPRGALAWEGQAREGGWPVRQAHVRPGEGDSFWLPDARVSLAHRGKCKLVMAARDPRDVALSCWLYWELPTLEGTVAKMMCRAWPLALPGWHLFVNVWLATGELDAVVRYADLQADAEGELARLLDALELEAVKPLAEVVERQSFEAKRADIDEHPERYSYNRAAQLHHMRRGTVGEGKAAFGAELEALARPVWEPTMERLGFQW